MTNQMIIYITERTNKKVNNKSRLILHHMFVKSKVIIDLDADPTQIQKIEFTGFLKMQTL